MPSLSSCVDSNYSADKSPAADAGGLKTSLKGLHLYKNEEIDFIQQCMKRRRTRAMTPGSRGYKAPDTKEANPEWTRLRPQ